jgi:hypothetical protein
VDSKVELGGRSFVAVLETTAEHDFLTMGHIRATGLSEAAQRPDESPEDFAVRLVGDLAASGRAFDILGSLLVPEGTESLAWTPKMGAETAAFMRGLTDQRSKNQLYTLTAQLMLAFFQDGLLSFKTSKPSSPGARRKNSPTSQNEAPSPSESGTAPSASSLETITPAPSPSELNGPSEKFWPAFLRRLGIGRGSNTDTTT